MKKQTSWDFLDKVQTAFDLRLTKRDARVILGLLDTLEEWSENFETGAYAKDWKHYQTKLSDKLMEIAYGKGKKTRTKTGFRATGKGIIRDQKAVKGSRKT